MFLVWIESVSFCKGSTLKKVLRMVHVSTRYYKDRRIAREVEKFISDVLIAFGLDGHFTVSLVKAIRGDAEKQGISFKMKFVNGVQCVIQPGDNGTCNVVNITTNGTEPVSRLQDRFLSVFSSECHRLSHDEIQEMDRARRALATEGQSTGIQGSAPEGSPTSLVVDGEVSASLIGFTRSQTNIDCSILALYETYGDHPFKYDDFYRVLRENGLCDDGVNGHQLAQVIAWLFRHEYLSRFDGGERMATLAQKSIKILEAAHIKKSSNVYGAKLAELESQAEAHEAASTEMRAANTRIGELNQEVESVGVQIRELTSRLEACTKERTTLLGRVDKCSVIVSDPLYSGARDKLQQILSLLA